MKKLINYYKRNLNKFKQMDRTSKVIQVIYSITRVLSVVVFVFAIVRIFINESTGIVRSTFPLLFQSFCLFFLTYVPSICSRFLHIKLPNLVEILLLLFSLATMLYGEIAHFYIKYSWWDDVIHTFSGTFITFIGFSILTFLNEKKNIGMKLSTPFMMFFAFCLAMTVESVWEITEYLIDHVTNLNMQTYFDDVTGIQYIGHRALKDTMTDIMETVLGSSIACVFAYFDIKLGKNKLSKFNFISVDEATEQTTL